MIKLLGLTLALALTVQGIPVDNGVEGDPEIECGPTSITVNFNTRNDFEGSVYVKGLHANDACINKDGGRQVAGIELEFDTCNTRRQRSLNPKGVFVSTTVIISFHPQFVTKVDRAYKIQCFYMEADKTVSTDLEVSMLTTDFRTQFVPMPICRYEIFEPGTDNIVQFALVGDPVEHRWTCDTETINTFCMVVHTCFVDDKNGDRVDLVNPDGCANDLFLLNNPEYPSDLTAAVEAHVFKYADRPSLYFECQISIQVKEPNDECPRPVCPSPPGRGAGGANPQSGPPPPQPRNPFPLDPNGPYVDETPQFGQPQLGLRSRRRFQRHIADFGKTVGTMDVSADIDAVEANENGLLPKAHRQFPGMDYRPVILREQSNDFCLSPATFTTIGAVAVLVVIALVAALGFLVAKRN